MGMLSWLSSMGSRLGLVQVAEVKDPQRPERITMRTLTLAELASEVRAEEVKALAELPAELSVSFEKVFEAAGVKSPQHGWTFERLKQFLAGDARKGMDRTAAQKAILAALAEAKAPTDDVVKDAVARDQALDAFESFVRKKMDARGTARQRRVAEIESQISALQEEQAKLKSEAKADEDHFRQWRQKKVEYEKQMSSAIGYLLDKPVVTVDEGE